MPSHIAVTLIILLVSALCESASTIPRFPLDINVTNILQQYVKLCGSKNLCNTSSVYVSTFEIENPMCAACFCDKGCYSRGDCCPDYLPLQCKHSVLVSNDRKLEPPESHYMVSTCHYNKKGNLKEKCDEEITDENFLQNYPVTVKTDPNITYRNVHCALCNDVTDAEPWSLAITCPNQTYFIQYSSPAEIWNAVSRNLCTMKYEPTSSHLKCENNQENVVDKCNISGQWNSYDKDIEWACANYNSRYGVFRNVFCFICNPRKIPENVQLINKCNVTGLWMDYSEEMVDGCEGYSKTSSPAFMKLASVDNTPFMPYKNRYCYACNANKETQSFMDSEVTLSEFYHSEYNLSFVTNFKIYALEDNTDIVDNNKQYREKSEETNTRRNINITKLWELYIKAGGTSNWCSKQFHVQAIPEETGHSCSCTRNCYSEGTCCPDYALNGPGSIVSGYLYGNLIEDTEEYQYVMLDRCPQNYQDKIIRAKCEKPILDDILTLVPVFDSLEKITYRNKFCRICHAGMVNEASKPLDNFVKYWDIQIRCSDIISFSMFPSLKSAIRFAVESACAILTLPKEDFILYHEPKVRQCNVTGNWLSRDSVIESACEESTLGSTIISNNTIFENIFCEICNHNKLGQSVSICNITGLMTSIDQEVIDDCRLGKGNMASYPYRNDKCERCNVMDAFPRKESISSSEYKLPQYRRLFSISQFLNGNKGGTSIIHERCEKNALLDPYLNKCRPIYCTSGKTLVEGSCRPLFEKINEIKYQIYFRLETEDVQSQEELTVLVSTDFKSSIASFLEKKILHGRISVTVLKLYVLFNATCPIASSDSSYITAYNHNNASDVNKFSFWSSVSISINSSNFMERQTLDERLLNITQSPITLTLGNRRFTFVPYFDQRAFNLPTTIHTAESSKYCKFINTEHSKAMVPFVVNKLIICKQFELETSEFTVASFGSIFIKELNKILKHGEFQIQPDDRIRICVSDYVLGSVSEDTDPMEIALQIFALICILSSLIALLLTFIAYSCFPILQSLPGKNIMCLVVALFFAQVMLLIEVFGSGPIFCDIIGALTHFFWLSCFFCMNVCSFHMYRVFTSKTAMDNNRHHDRKILIRYCLYSFGTPFLIVLINIVAGLIMYKGRKTLYGGKECFQGTLLSFIFSFIVPISIIFITNMVFFIITACKIKASPNDTSTRNPQYSISIYMKLFTLTGLTWTLQIVDSMFFNTSLFSFVVTLLNGCQGVYIFISYVCTNRVLKIIREKYSQQRLSNGTSELQTKSRILRSQTISDSRKLSKSITAFTIMDSPVLSKSTSACVLMDSPDLSKTNNVKKPETNCVNIVKNQQKEEPIR